MDLGSFWRVVRCFLCHRHSRRRGSRYIHSLEFIGEKIVVGTSAELVVHCDDSGKARSEELDWEKRIAMEMLDSEANTWQDDGVAQG